MKSTVYQGSISKSLAPGVIIADPLLLDGSPSLDTFLDCRLWEGVAIGVLASTQNDSGTLLSCCSSVGGSGAPPSRLSRRVGILLVRNDLLD